MVVELCAEGPLPLSSVLLLKVPTLTQQALEMWVSRGQTNAPQIPTIFHVKAHGAKLLNVASNLADSLNGSYVATWVS